MKYSILRYRVYYSAIMYMTIKYDFFYCILIYLCNIQSFGNIVRVQPWSRGYLFILYPEVLIHNPFSEKK